jgi:hypothetical protein
MLSSWPGPFAGADLQVVETKIGRSRSTGQHRDRHRGAVYSTRSLGGRNPLPAMTPRLLGKQAFSFGAGDKETGVPAALIAQADVKAPSALPRHGRW